MTLGNIVFGSVENCVAVETVVINSLRENTNVLHKPENATETSIKRINVRMSKVSGSETS